MASIHAEVPSKVDIEISHAVVDQIERDALEKLGIFLVINMDRWRRTTSWQPF